ncbi:MAG: hypothetical protein H6Q66_367 [Firmicutes bacterium]|nr:hypothetical protein [Bacillota bacterium]
MYISLYDLGLFFCLLVAIAIGGYLIAVLRQVLGVVSHVRTMLAEQDKDVRKALALFPETLENVNALTVSLKEIVDQTGDTVHVLQTEVTDTVDDLQASLETFITYAKLISDILRGIFLKK